MDVTLDPSLFDGLSIYQDVVLNGKTVLAGVRDCRERWELIEPMLGREGAILDVGSNFGWFGLQICGSRPHCVVASVEADARSATIQRKVLVSHADRRIVLLTARADRRMLGRFQRAGQHFEAVLCLSILHWIPEHQAFLTLLGKLSRRLFIEYPEPDEPDAGDAKIRREIGAIEDYLRVLFPNRPLACLGDCASHLSAAHRRRIWMVDAPPPTPLTDNCRTPMGLQVASLMNNDPSWPPRSWWSQEIEKTKASNPAWNKRADATTEFVAAGLSPGKDLKRIAKRLWRAPEDALYAPGKALREQARRVVSRIRRALDASQ